MESQNYFAIPGIHTTIESLIKLTENKYNIAYEVMKSKSRVSRVAEARFYAMYLIRKELQLSQREIGELFNRDHATVIHACNVIETRMETNQLLA